MILFYRNPWAIYHNHMYLVIIVHMLCYVLMHSTLVCHMSNNQIITKVGFVFKCCHFNVQVFEKKSESLQTEGRHFRSMICKINDV